MTHPPKQFLLAAALVLAATTFLPTATAADEPVDCHGPLDGYQYCEVELGRCHAGEEIFQGDYHAHAECQPSDGKSRCGVDAYAMPLLVTRHCGSTYTTVWPVGASAQDFCEEHPGYRQCDYPAGPCTVTIYYLYHDAQYVVDPHCDLPLAAASSTDATVDPCTQQPGYEQCRVDLGLCDAETRYYQHDAFYVVGANCYGKNSTCSYYSHQVYGHDEGLDCKDFIAEMLGSTDAAGAPATTDADICQDRPTSTFCGYEAGGCEAGLALHDDGRIEPIYRCTPPQATSSTDASPIDCQGTDGVLACQVAPIAGCWADFRYESSDLQHAEAQCGEPFGDRDCGLGMDRDRHYRHWTGCYDGDGEQSQPCRLDPNGPGLGLGATCGGFVCVIDLFSLPPGPCTV